MAGIAILLTADPRPIAAETARLSVQNFGAVGDGRADDSPAIRAAIAALPAGGTLEFPAGTYHLGSEVVIREKTGVNLIGRDALIHGLPMRSYLSFERCRGVRVSGLSFDCRADALPVYESFALGERQAAIRFFEGSRLTVDACNFRNLYTVFVLFHSSSALAVKNCEFCSPLQRQDQYLTFVEVLSCSGAVDVAESRFCGAATTRNDRSPSAVSASGITGSLRIADNSAEHCGRNNAGGHRLAVFDIYADAVNVEVARNVAVHCREQFMRLSTTVGAEVHHNTVFVAPEADTTYSTLTIESGSFANVAHPVSRQIAIHDNQFVDPFRRQAYGIGVVAYDWGAANESIAIADNLIAGYATALLVAGPFDGLTITGNQASDVNAFLAQSLVGTVPLTSKLGYEGQSKFEALTIADNIIEVRDGSDQVPISLSTNRTVAFTGTIGAFELAGNRIIAARARAQFAISALLNGSRASGQLVARNNEIAGYATPFYLRSLTRATLSGNRAQGSREFYRTDGSVASIDEGGTQRVSALPAHAARPIPRLPSPLPCNCGSS